MGGWKKKSPFVCRQKITPHAMSTSNLLYYCSTTVIFDVTESVTLPPYLTIMADRYRINARLHVTFYNTI